MNTRHWLLAAGVFIALMVFFLYRLVSQRSDLGKVVYSQHCENCHMEDGQGLGNLIPPLAQSDVLHDPQAVVCITVNGIKGDIVVNGETYSGAMAGFPELTDGEITNLMNYLYAEWAPEKQRFNIVDVKAMRKICGSAAVIPFDPVPGD